MDNALSMDAAERAIAALGSVAEVARVTGKHVSAVSHWRTGERPMDVVSAMLLDDACKPKQRFNPRNIRPELFHVAT